MALAVVTRTLVVETLRRLYPRLLAKTLGLTRSLPDAEDAVQDAIERALKTWPSQGAPDSAEAWLLTVAANSHRDRRRRGQREQPREDALEALAQMSPWARSALGNAEVARGWKDELLGLLYACCHPVLQAGESAALALTTVIGFSISEASAAFLVQPRSMEQRLTRARQRLREHGDYELGPREEPRERLDAVLRTLHLLYNEGYWASSGDSPLRPELCRLALGLAHSLHEALPEQAEVCGLLALFMLHEARRPARLDDHGHALPLTEQDRSRWDRDAIGEATALLEQALALGRPGPFQIEAAISAVHCRAQGAAATDWREISALYALLEGMRPTPAVRVNRAFALGKARGAAAGLSLLDGGGSIDVASYPYVHLVRSSLLEELGRIDEAVASLKLAQAAARNAQERAQLDARLERLAPSTSKDRA